MLGLAATLEFDEMLTRFRSGPSQVCRFMLGAGLVLASQIAVAGLTESDTLELKWLRLQAVALEHGEGVEKDELQAHSLYCDAARRGDPEALFSLGWMYANGRGFPRDDGRALYLFRAAAESGHEHAVQMVARLAGQEAVQPECLQVKIEEEAVDEEGPAVVEHDPTIPKRVVDLVNRLAPEYRIHPKLALAVIRVESGFDPKAVSPKSAQGLMQLIPDTAKRFNVKNPFDPEQNLRGGLAYLRWLLAYFRGDVPLVLAGYNAGEGAVDRYRGVPPYLETRTYVKRVMALYGRESHPFVEDGVSRPSETRFRQ